MKKDDIKKKTEEIFTFLYKEGVSPSFRFPKGHGASILDKFSDSFTDKERIVSLGVLVDFCLHQAYLWRDAERWNRFTVLWAFGPKAIDRFYSSKSGVRYYQDIWLKEKFGMGREELKAKFVDLKEHPLKKFIYIIAEDRTKARLLNTDAGFGLCLSQTTLFTPASPICQKCDNSRECEDLIKISNPELHRLRDSNKSK